MIGMHGPMVTLVPTFLLYCTWKKNPLFSRKICRLKLSHVLDSIKTLRSLGYCETSVSSSADVRFRFSGVELMLPFLFPASYRSFLFSKEGNPNKRNVHNETCLHVLCQGPMILLLSAGALSPRLARPERDDQLRADCLQVQTRLPNVGLKTAFISPKRSLA